MSTKVGYDKPVMYKTTKTIGTVAPHKFAGADDDGPCNECALYLEHHVHRALRPPTAPAVRIASGSSSSSAVETIAAQPEPADPSRYFTREGFTPSLLCEEIRAAGPLRLGVDGRLWRYQGGVFHREGEAFAASYTRQALGEKFKKRHRDEVQAWLLSEEPSIGGRPSRDVINCSNGLLHWATGRLEPHSPDQASTIQIPVAWNPDAECPLIERFLGDVLPGDAINLALEIAGYCLLADQPFRRAVMLLGSGSNGKSTFLGLLRALLGPRNVTSIQLQAFAESRFAAASLYGMLANLCGDLDARSLKRSDTFKTLTGGTDSISAERKYGQPFEFVPFATLVFSANEAPASSDQTDAYFDRWIIVPFKQRFSEQGQAATATADPKLLAKLTTAGELSGLLRHSVDALRELVERGGFEPPESVRGAGRAYRENLDTVVAFIEECCVIGSDTKVGRAPLFERYRRWCSANGRYAVHTSHFTTKLRQELKEQLSEGKIGPQRERAWTGIGLRDETATGTPGTHETANPSFPPARV